ncbi:hypothetical protein ThvES_00010070 [Thiovulum sp. ES]|nr:hypothetical protein ThvES_00010070 [Thiovulum sp. ES]
MPEEYKKYDVDFKSLRNNEYWIEIHTFYKENIEKIAPLIDRIQEKYGMDFETARDSILYEIVNAHAGTDHRKKLFSKKRYSWSLKYILFFIFSLFSGFINLLISPFLKNRNFDILYEEMWEENSWFSRFYKYIDIELPKDKTRAILFDHPAPAKPFFKKPRISMWNDEVINRRYGAFIFDWKEVLRVLWKEKFSFFRLWKFSKDFNFTYIYFRFLRKILLYKTQVQKVKAKNLIMAGDYYWNPVKYFQFKKSISNIILIQHNIKASGIRQRAFLYADYYFTHSEDSNYKMEGVGKTKLISVGSFQLIPFLQKKEIEYDILFINQTVYDKLKEGTPLLDQEKLQKEHNILIENFYKYIYKNKDLKAIYIAKPGYTNREPFLSVEEKFKDLENVKFTSAYGSNMFDLVQKSKIIINMYSSVGREAYGLDKKVLWINYNHSCTIFNQNVDFEDLHILLDNSYDAFKSRIDLFLSNSDEVDQHFEKLKKKYMNIQENSANIILDSIF